MGQTTYSGLSNTPYSSEEASATPGPTVAHKMVSPFFKITVKKPYGTVAPYTEETFTIDSLTVTNAHFGVNGRFMDIVYEAGDADPTATNQILIKDSVFTDNKADGDGGLMKIDANTLFMKI